ncbi:hypothetical protein NIES3806_40110 [Microcystis aeruginosa NIES-3806]|nr:hypothetical protein NIES3806_40110 [Microcystis aeruginosa NIES-3806]
MGTVIVFIAGISIIISKVVLINNFVGNAIVVGIGAKEGMIKVNACINNDGAIVFALKVEETGVLPELIEGNER